MHKLISLGMLVAVIGLGVLIYPRVTCAQVEGALQYPPPSVGEDAQPPPPARMVPQIVSPRRIELGFSGSSQPPTIYPYRVHPRTDMDRVPGQPAPFVGASPIAAPTAAGN